jgi:hypothetical protein
MKKALILLLIAVLSLLSCGKAVKKVTDESKTAQEAIALAEEIKEAYLKEDLAVIEKNTTKEGYREFLGAVKRFDRAELTFSPKWVEIEKTFVSMKIAWSGKWVVGEQTAEERGTAIFIFEGSPLKLNRVLRANPFRQPE